MSSETLSILSIIANFLAVMAAPVIAVVVARRLERDKNTYDRRMETFRRFVATLRVRLHPDHVFALNLIQIEFSGVATIMTAWRAYMEHLAKHFPETASDEQVNAFVKEQDRLRTKLTQEVATFLGIKVEPLDVHELAYAPHGWEKDELDQRALRSLFIQVLENKRPIPVAPFSGALVGNPFPPRPAVATPVQPRPATPSQSPTPKPKRSG